MAGRLAGADQFQCSVRQAVELKLPGIAIDEQHLADSDLVLGWRMRMILAHDRPPLTGYDQDLWAARLGYEKTTPDDALREFAVLRKANLRLMQRASANDLQRVGVHSERGDESIEYMMRLYAGHDLLHLRQIERIRRSFD